MRRLALILAAAAAVIGFLPATTAMANSVQYLCISSTLPAQCADLPVFTQGDTLIMENSSHPYGAGLGWIASYTGNNVSSNWPFTSGSGLNTRYNGRPIYMIEKSTSTGHDGCIWGNTSPFNAEWNFCNSGNNADWWVKSSYHYWVNVGVSNILYIEGGPANTPYSLSDALNGSGNGSDINVWKTNNPWYLDTP
jgi:hypothetical protein